MKHSIPTFDAEPIDRQHPFLHVRLRRCIAVAVAALLVASPAGVGSAHGLEVPDPVAAAAEEASGWPDFDPSDMSDEVAATEARDAVAGWPDFDSTDMSRKVAIAEAQQEAAGWPNFDSTALADPANQIVVAISNPTLSPIEGSEAEVVLSPSAIAGSPRMTQIAASQAQADEDVAPVAAGPNSSTF